MIIFNLAVVNTDLSLRMILRLKKQDLDSCLTWGSNNNDWSNITPRLRRFRWTAEEIEPILSLIVATASSGEITKTPVLLAFSCKQLTSVLS